jgi:AcrR family transcriptional regulator
VGPTRTWDVGAMLDTTTKRGGARGPYAKSEWRRAQILKAAFDAFSSVGYRNASMLQMAADCGVSRTALLHYFPTKESLLEAVLEERDRKADELFFADAPEESSDGIQYFSRLIKVIEHNARNPGIVSLFAVLSTESSDISHPAHAYFIARYERALKRTKAALGNLAARSLVRPHIVLDGLEVDIIALVDGLQIQWLLQPSLVDMAARLRSRLREITVAEIP